MEQSRESYEKLSKRAKDAAETERGQKEDIEAYARNDLREPTEMLYDGINLVRKALGRDAATAEKKLQQYMDEGRAEATELNQEYESLKLVVLQSKQELEDYVKDHIGEVFVATRQTLEKKLREAVQKLEEFETTKLGMIFDAENEEAA